MQTRLLRVTDEGTEQCICRLEGDALVMELRLIGRAPYTSRKAFGSDDPASYAPTAQWSYAPLVQRKLGEGFVCFGDGAAAGPYEPLFRAAGGSSTFDLHPDSRAIVYATLRSEAYGADIHVLDLRSGRSRVVHGVDSDHAAPRQTWIRDLRYHPGGEAIYFTLNENVLKIDLAPAGGGPVARVLFDDGRGDARIDMDPARRFVVVHDAARARVLATADDRTIFEQSTWGPQFADIKSAAISASGRLVAVASEQNEVRVFEVATREQIHRVILDKAVQRVGFAPGERALLVAHEWNQQGPYVYTFDEGGAGFHFTDESGAPRTTPSWSFDPDGERIALAGRELRVCAAGTWQELHRGPASGDLVVFSRDGRLLVSGGREFVVYKATSEAIAWPAPAVTPAPADLPQPHGFDARALVQEWDGLHTTGDFPCGEGYFGDKFSVWDARLEVYASTDSAQPRYLVVFQVIGEDFCSEFTGNSIFVIGDRPDWPERDMLSHARISSPQQTRITQDYGLSDERAREEDADYVMEPQDPAGDWARLQKFRVRLDDDEYTLEPSLADYAGAGVELTERQYRADPTAARTTMAKVASLLLRDRMWVADPLKHAGLAGHFARAGVPLTRIYSEDGVDVVAHITRRGPPGGLPRWRTIARLLAEGARSELHVTVDPVEAAVRREYFPGKPGDQPLSDAELATVVSVHLHDDQRAADLGFLARLPNVRVLHLFRTQVRELGVLSRLPQLEELNLAGCPVVDLSPLVACRELRSLTLSHTRVHDLRPLAGLDAMQSLDIEGTSVRDLAPLRSHRGLRELFLDDTEVEDLAPLRGLGLVRLFMRDTKVTDVSPLADMQSLAVLTLPPTVADLDALRGLHIHEQLVAQRRAGTGAMASKYVG